MNSLPIGAYKAKLKKDGTFAVLTKAFPNMSKRSITLVSLSKKLTGITQETLEEKGIPYIEAMAKFKKYIGRDYKKAKFVTFGNHDIRIFSQSEHITGPSEGDLFDYIRKNHVDLSRVISEYIKDDKQNPLSLTNYCKVFDVKMSGTNHEALSDAKNLALLYNAVLKSPQVVGIEYKKVLENGKGMPRPNPKIDEATT